MRFTWSIPPNFFCFGFLFCFYFLVQLLSVEPNRGRDGGISPPAHQEKQSVASVLSVTNQCIVRTSKTNAGYEMQQWIYLFLCSMGGMWFWPLDLSIDWWVDLWLNVKFSHFWEHFVSALLWILPFSTFGGFAWKWGWGTNNWQGPIW